MSEKKRRGLEIDATFDIECASWTVFLCGALHINGQTHVYWFNQEEKFVDHILSLSEGKKITLWGHNAGGYDTKWLLNHMVKRRVRAKLVVIGGSVIGVRFGALTIRDSYRVAPISLAEFSTVGGYEKLPFPLDCQCGRTRCMGYCRLSRRMPAADKRKVETYLVRDCHALTASLTELETICARVDWSLCSTIGESAWHTASRRLGLPDAPYNYRTYMALRAGYYGGRTQVFRPGKVNYETGETEIGWSGYSRDINSAYPGALAYVAMPHGELTESRRRKKEHGIFQAVVTVPKMWIPPLPYRTRHRISYPTGTFEGCWTGIELDYAEKCGVKIEKITRAWEWSEHSAKFAPIMEEVWSFRAANKGTPIAMIAKFFGNAFSGKLAQHPDTEEVELDPEHSKVTFCNARPNCPGVFCGSPTYSKCCSHECRGTCGSWAPLSLEMGIYARPIQRMPASGHIQLAAYTTSATRILLHDALTEDDSAIYCDTDNDKSVNEHSRHSGTELRKFKTECRFVEFVALAPKTYSYIDADTGEFHAKAKGVPDADRVWNQIASGKPITNTHGVAGFRSAIKTNDAFQRKNLTRAKHLGSPFYGDRRLLGDTTHAPTIEEVRERRT